MTGAAPERLLHGATLGGAGLASLLLFTVEPLLAKQLLPSFGGGPGVWIAALCYFQILLLGAYLHGAHLARRSGGWQLALHAPPILASLLALPPLLDGAVVAGGGSWTALRLLLSLGRASALPFFVLAANTSLASAQVARRGVAARRILAHGHHDNFVQIAFQLTAQRLGPQAAPFTDARGTGIFRPLGVLGSWRAQHHGAWPRRLRLGDHALRFDPENGRHAVRAAPGQQLVHDHAQGINV